MMDVPYRRCNRCVMDTTDPEIEFDQDGVCHHCKRYEQMVRDHVHMGEVGARRLGAFVDVIQRDGAGKPFDCVVGLSGGVDSTFVAYQTKALGLRPLLVHLDNGWNSREAAQNIERAVAALGLELYTHTLDREEFRDLQIAFLRASTPDSEIPTDHAIWSLLRIVAEKHGIRHVISGFNVRTESHLPPAWSQGHYDWKYIKTVHRRFGTVPLKTFPHTNFWAYHRSYFTLKRLDLLNYIDYVKQDAMRLMERELGWQYYGGKHYESIYTRFYQGYILPRKFGFDKRKTHLSSLICSGEITREEALAELEREAYPAELQREDLAFVVQKLGLSEAEFDRIMASPKRSYWDFPSYGRFYRSGVYRGVLGLYRAVRQRR